MSHAKPTATAIPHASPPFLAGKTIAVAGAGIGGVTFALAMIKLWKPLREPRPRMILFERDSYEERTGREGYTLSVRADEHSGGIQILDKLDIYQKVRQNSVKSLSEDMGDMVFWDHNWNEILRMKAGAYGPNKLRHMRIRRNALQRVLADTVIESGVDIRWSTAITDVKKMEDGKMQVVASNGTTVDCDLLVSADGAKSKIRGLLRPELGLNFAGVLSTTGTAKFENEALIPAPLTRDWGVVTGTRGIGLFVAPVDRMQVLWSFSERVSEPGEQIRHPIPKDKINKILDQARTWATDYSDKIQTLIDSTDPTTLMVYNAFDRPPFAHTPAVHGSVVWLGDANHAVSPFAGNGANMAMMDGWDLAQCLCSKPSLEEALAEYDNLSMPRSNMTLKISHFNIDIFHATGWRLFLYKLLGYCLSWLPFFLPGRGKS